MPKKIISTRDWPAKKMFGQMKYQILRRKSRDDTPLQPFLDVQQGKTRTETEVQHMIQIK